MKSSIAGLALALALGTGAMAAASGGYHVLDRIPGPDGFWDGLDIDAASGRVLVTRGDKVMAVDLKSKAVTPAAFTGSRLHVALPVNGSSEILLTNGASDTAVFANARTGAVVATVQTGKGPDAAAVDSKTGLVLVMDHAGGDVTLIDPRRHEAVGRIEVGGALEEAATDGRGRAFVNVENQNQIAVLDLARRKVIARYALDGCDGPTGLAYDATDELLIAACDGVTDMVDAKTGKVLQTLMTGKGADGVAYDRSKKLAFVPAGRDGTLAVISVGRGSSKIVELVQTARSARTIAYDSKTGRVYLPSAQFGPPPAGGGRPTLVPGSFELLVVGR